MRARSARRVNYLHLGTATDQFCGDGQTGDARAQNRE